MKIPLRINDTESKIGAKGKTYLRVNTSEGWMSCFIKTTAQAVVASKGKWVKATLGGVGQFENKNIFEIEQLPVQPGHVEEKTAPEPIKKPVEAETGFKISRMEATMIMSYTKDLVVAGKLQRDDFHEYNAYLSKLTMSHVLY